MLYLLFIPYGLIYTYLAYRLGCAVSAYRAYDKVMTELYNKLAESKIANKEESNADVHG